MLFQSYLPKKAGDGALRSSRSGKQCQELSFSFFSILKGERLRHYFNHIVANEEQNMAAMWESNEWATIFIKKIVSEACKFSVEKKIRKAKNRIQLKLEHCKITFCGKYACRRYSGV